MDLAREAYERRLAEIEAVPEAALIHVNVDVRSAAVTVLGALPRIEMLRSQIARLAEIDQAKVDSLEDLALAATEAHSRYVVTSVSTAALDRLKAKVTQARDTFRLVVGTLAQRGLVHPSLPRAFKGQRGSLNIASDTIDYATALLERWDAIGDKTGMTAQEVVQAKELATDLLYAVCPRPDPKRAHAAANRKRAFTLLVTAYEEVRRAVMYLRWKEGDGDVFAPSLYAGRRRAAASANAEAPLT